jgi:hypothetical protein
LGFQFESVPIRREVGTVIARKPDAYPIETGSGLETVLIFDRVASGEFALQRRPHDGSGTDATVLAAPDISF